MGTGSGRRGFRPHWAIPALSILCALWACPQAFASDTIGEAYGTSGGVPCPNGETYIQKQSADNRYAAPYDGVITSWTTGGFWPTASFKVARLGAGTSYSVVGQDGPQTTGYNVAATYATRITVRQGDVIGAYVPPSSTTCFYTGQSGDVTGYSAGDVAPGPGSFDSTDGRQVPIEAQIEHDADGDGYGDETQDGCPTDPTIHDVCDVFPPETTVTKGPKKKTKSKSATFEFSSSEAGSTFECSLDGAKFSACSSPLKVKVKGFGKHNFLVRARDSHGNLDTSEASWSWKVKKKKHKH